MIKMKKKKKRAFTLIELMVVIVIIGLIGGVVAYNVRGSLEKGKAFKTAQAAKMIHEVVEMELATGSQTLSSFVQKPVHFLKKSGMVKNPASIIKDGWGEPFTFEEKNGRLTISSSHYDDPADA
jgi:prepilin-type N-terminal cleavage/methylation domain-containing protein